MASATGGQLTFPFNSFLQRGLNGLDIQDPVAFRANLGLNRNPNPLTFGSGIITGSVSVYDTTAACQISVDPTVFGLVPNNGNPYLRTSDAQTVLTLEGGNNPSISFFCGQGQVLSASGTTVSLQGDLDTAGKVTASQGLLTNSIKATPQQQLNFYDFNGINVMSIPNGGVSIPTSIAFKQTNTTIGQDNNNALNIENGVGSVSVSTDDSASTVSLVCNPTNPVGPVNKVEVSSSGTAITGALITKTIRASPQQAISFQDYNGTEVMSIPNGGVKVPTSIAFKNTNTYLTQDNNNNLRIFNGVGQWSIGGLIGPQSNMCYFGLRNTGSYAPPVGVNGQSGYLFDFWSDNDNFTPALRARGYVFNGNNDTALIHGSETGGNCLFGGTTSSIDIYTLAPGKTVRLRNESGGKSSTVTVSAATGTSVVNGLTTDSLTVSGMSTAGYVVTTSAGVVSSFRPPSFCVSGSASSTGPLTNGLYTSAFVERTPSVGFSVSSGYITIPTTGRYFLTLSVSAGGSGGAISIYSGASGAVPNVGLSLGPLSSGQAYQQTTTVVITLTATNRLWLIATSATSSMPTVQLTGYYIST